MTWITVNNVQRGVTQKVGNSELWFLYQGDIHLHKVLRKYLKQFLSYINILQKSLFPKFKGP